MEARKLRQLKRVLNSRASKRREYLKDPEVQKILREVSLNVLKGNISLTPLQKRKLKEHARQVRILACPRTSHKSRVRISQRGGLLAALAVPLISGLLGGLFKKMRPYTLVPSEMVQAWQNQLQHQREQHPQLTERNNLRRDMNSTLDQVPPTYQGYQEYATKLGQYMRSVKESPPSAPDVVRNLGEALPVNLKSRGTALLQRLLREDRFRVGEHDTISIDNQNIPSSNVVDLVRFFTGKSTHPPPGADALQRLLQQINVPSTLAPNRIPEDAAAAATPMSPDNFLTPPATRPRVPPGTPYNTGTPPTVRKNLSLPGSSQKKKKKKKKLSPSVLRNGKPWITVDK